MLEFTRDVILYFVLCCFILYLLMDVANILLINYVNLCIDFSCLILCLLIVFVVRDSS